MAKNPHWVFPCPVKSVSYSAYNRNTGPAEQ